MYCKATGELEPIFFLASLFLRKRIKKVFITKFVLVRCIVITIFSKRSWRKRRFYKPILWLLKASEQKKHERHNPIFFLFILHSISFWVKYHNYDRQGHYCKEVLRPFIRTRVLLTLNVTLYNRASKWALNYDIHMKNNMQKDDKSTRYKLVV